MALRQVIEEVKCSHCGELCRDTEITTGDHIFCCEGCKLVFDLLAENNLCAFYELDENPGRTIETNIAAERKRFDYLLNPDIEKKLLQFRSPSLAALTLSVPQIHCASCIWLLENLYKLDTGILDSKVNFLKREISIRFNPEVTSVRNIAELLTTIGYEPDLRLAHLEKKKEPDVKRRLWLKLGVAGFSFGNIMLFSFPEYLSISSPSPTVSFQTLFGVLNILLALPVLFYSGFDYLKSAAASLGQKKINLDVPISLGMITLFGRSVYEIISATGVGYLDSLAGFVFFLLIGKILQQKTFDRISFDRDYKSYLPISVMKLAGETESSVPVSQLEIGDSIRLRNNELIPADSVLTSDEASVDYSFITGENDPVSVAKGDYIYAGGKIIGPHAVMTVSKKAEHSYLTRLWDNEAFSEDKNPEHIGNFADRVSPVFTLAVIIIAVVSSLIWYMHEPSSAFLIFTAVLIVACPCALALSAPFSFGSAANILALNGLYVRAPHVIEALAKSNVLIFDKTGTITKNDAAEITYEGAELTPDECALVKSVTAMSLHPLNKMITRFLEVPDSPAEKITELKETTGKGIIARTAHSEIILGSRSFLLDRLPSEKHNITSRVVDDETAGTRVLLAVNGVYKGMFKFKTEFRPGAASLLRRLQQQFELRLLSGDNEKEKMQFSPFFHEEDMYFNQKPEDKLEFVKRLQATGARSTMVGDGLNDAGALKYSSFGIAISDDMSSFSPASDAILEGDQFKKLDKIIQLAQKSVRVVLGSFGLSLLYNTTGLLFAVTGNLSPLVAAILMPLSSVSVMVFTTLAVRMGARKLELKIWA